MRPTAIVLAVAVLGAGCLSGGGEAPGEADEELDKDATDRSKEAANATERQDEAANASDEPDTTWTEREIDETVTQGAWLVTQPKASFEVPEAVQEVRLNVSYEGDVPLVVVYPPDCDRGEHVVMAQFDCGDDRCPDEGTFFETQAPQAGEWEMSFGACGALDDPSARSELTLTVAKRGPASAS